MASPKPKVYTAYLSPIDHMNPHFYTRMFFVFPTPDPSAAVVSLRRGFQKASTLVPFTSGRIIIDRDPGLRPLNQAKIQWTANSGATADLLEKIAPPGFPTFEEMVRDHAPTELFNDDIAPMPDKPPAWDARGGYTPLLAGFCRIEGGMVLCLGATHALMDGTGMGIFARLWADCTRQLEEQAVDGQVSGAAPVSPAALPAADEPLHRLYRLLKVVTGTGEPRQEKSLDELVRRHPEWIPVVEYDRIFSTDGKALDPPPTPPPQAAVAPAPESSQPKLKAKILAFSGPKLEAAKQVLTSSCSRTIALTVNLVLAAIIWSAATRVRLNRLGKNAVRGAGLKGSHSSTFIMAVDGRPRLGVEGPYLGNLHLVATSFASFSQLEATSSARSGCDNTTLAKLAPLIDSISASTARVTPEYLDELLQIMSKVGTVPDVSRASKELWHPFHLAYSSWATLGLCDECDFGKSVGGLPRFVRTPCMNIVDGVVVALPRDRRTKEGHEDLGERIELEVMMNAADVTALEGDEMLRSWFW